MLLTKEVEIKILANNVEYYKNLGYEIPMRYSKKTPNKLCYDIGKFINVKIEDIPKNSHVTVRVLCDLCKENEIDVRFQDYNKSIDKTGSYVCKNCSIVKQKNTIKNRYEVDCVAKIPGVQEKRKETSLRKYGFDNSAKSPMCKEKKDNTCRRKYGENYNQLFAEKAFKTFYENTGYKYPLQNPDVRTKITKSLLEHYGVKNPSQSLKIREKISQSLYDNSSQSVSFQQRYIHNLYGGVLNYPLNNLNLDICFPDDKFCIEYDGGGHNLQVKLGNITQEEFIHKEIIRNNVVKYAGYKLMKIVSSRDYLPSDEILLQMLSHAKEYFSNYPNHSWIEFKIDTSTVRNAEQKDGVFFDYGELRKIKSIDIKVA